MLSNRDFFVQLKQMSTVIVAIILRETKTRFGKNKLGYLWAIIEPCSYILIFLYIRSALHMRIPFGENLFLFIISGLLTYRMFKSVTGRALNAISANQALLTYPQVKPLDTVIARIILEITTMLVVFFVFFSLLNLFSKVSIIHYPERFAGAISATILLSLGVGLFNAVLATLSPSWERIWGLCSLPLLILSGIFYIPKSLPPAAQSILQWNPVLNCIEWMRSAIYLDYDPLLSRSYVVWFALIAILVGLILERYFRYYLVRQ